MRSRLWPLGVCLLAAVHCLAQVVVGPPGVVNRGGNPNSVVIASGLNTNIITMTRSNVSETYYALSPAMCTNYTTAYNGSPFTGLPCLQWWTNGAGNTAILYDPTVAFLSQPWGLDTTNFLFTSTASVANWEAVSIGNYPWFVTGSGSSFGIPTNVSFAGQFLSITSAVYVVANSLPNAPNTPQPLLEVGLTNAGGLYTPQIRLGSENDSDKTTNGYIMLFADSRNYSLGGNLDIGGIWASDLAYQRDTATENREAGIRFREPLAGGTNGGQLYFIIRQYALGAGQVFSNAFFADTNAHVVIGPKVYPFETTIAGVALEVFGGSELVDGAVIAATGVATTNVGGAFHLTSSLGWTNQPISGGVGTNYVVQVRIPSASACNITNVLSTAGYVTTFTNLAWAGTNEFKVPCGGAICFGAANAIIDGWPSP